VEGDYEMAFIFLNTNVDEGPGLQRTLRVLRDGETGLRMSRKREAQEARMYCGQAKTRQGRNRQMEKKRGKSSRTLIVKRMIVGIRREPRRRKSRTSMCRLKVI